MNKETRLRMSDATNITTTVMFADICDSTRLFSKLGDEKAYSLIDQALKLTAGLLETLDDGGELGAQAIEVTVSWRRYDRNPVEIEDGGAAGAGAPVEQFLDNFVEIH